MDFEVKHLICAGLDVHKKTIVAAVCMTDPVTLEAAYKVKSFSPTIRRLQLCVTSFSHITAMMSAWNPLVNTGFQFLTSLKRICTWFLHTPNTSKP